MTIVIDRPHYKLRATVHQSIGSLYNLELEQLHPNAQRPHWRQIVQLSPTRKELAALRDVISEALDDQ